MGAGPLDRLPQARLQIEARLPADSLADLRRVDPLAVDLSVGVPAAADVGLHPGSRQPGDELDDFPHRVRGAAAGVEGLTSHLVAVEVVGESKVGGDGILDVEEVA